MKALVSAVAIIALVFAALGLAAVGAVHLASVRAYEEPRETLADLRGNTRVVFLTQRDTRLPASRDRDC